MKENLHLFKQDGRENFHLFDHTEEDDFHFFKKVEKDRKNNFRGENYDGSEPENSVELYAEFSRSHMKKLESGEYDLEVPEGTSVRNVNGTRRFTFTCVNKKIADMVKEALNDDGIMWQET